MRADQVPACQRLATESRARALRIDPAKLETAIEAAQARLSALCDEHDKAATVADELWRQVLDAQRRLASLYELKGRADDAAGL